MSWTKEITIWCDGKNRGCLFATILGEAKTIVNARIAAGEKGWVYWNGRDLCPDCKKNWKLE